jgi:nucleoside-diphosphate-sugar epimerase
VLLARGRRGQTAAARVQRLFERSPCFRPLRERHGDALGAFLADRVAVVEGDVRRPMLGIDERAVAVLLPRIDAVIHVAGLTDLEPDPREGVAVNVRGAMHATELAARTRGRRTIHVSTCYVAGQGSREVPETLTPGRSPNGTRFDPEGELVAIESVCEAVDQRHEGDAVAARRERLEAGTRRARALGWPNLYTYTKGLGEQLIAQVSSARGVATTIVRPAIVECAREFPFPGWNEGVNTSGPLVWLVGTIHRRMPFARENHFDVVPVDSVARGTTLALVDALRDREGRGVRAVFQLASSDHNPLTLGRALELSVLARRRQYAKSDDPFERLVLSQLDSVAVERAAADNRVLPAARKVTRSIRDALVAFDPKVHLPRAVREVIGDDLRRTAQKVGKSLGNASRTIGQVEQMLRVYQPFTFDDDLVFRTDRVRDATQMLHDAERAAFGYDVHEIDWRRYWLDVQIPGLDRWSLPILRGERVEDDAGTPLDRPLARVEDEASSRSHATVRRFETASLGEDAE